MSVVTRFAPSPTGFLHIGGARTALFNWLYAKHCGGTFLLRIEDTDRKRSTQEAIDAILEGLDWLGLNWDGEPIYQFARAARHAEIARSLIAAGNAYHCYASPEELEAMRETAKAEGRPVRYDGRWRDRDPADAPPGVAPVIRLKAPQDGETVIEDAVQGTVRVANAQLDDMVLLRADGTPTYMLSVVVDDHDMGITDVIRGDDHLTNASRQTLLYQACGWTPPRFAHIPLIHGADGAKLSKRHGALGAQDYRDMGFLPEALRNYLLRLGWSHGDDEIISTEDAIRWFDIADAGKAAARFDLAKLTNLNGHYIREAEVGRLTDLCLDRLHRDGRIGIDVDLARVRVLAGMNGLRQRAKTLVELADSAALYTASRPLALSEKAVALLQADGAQEHLRQLLAALRDQMEWSENALESLVKSFSETRGIKLGVIAQPLRAALTGSHVSPGIFEVMSVLGRAESLDRISDCTDL